MASAIGGVTCTFVKMNFAGPRQRVRTWPVPGVDGQGAQSLGQSGPVFPAQLVLYDSVANVTTWFTNVEALVGTVITITDDLGVTYTEVLVANCGPRQARAVIGSGGAACRGEIVMFCQSMGTV